MSNIAGYLLATVFLSYIILMPNPRIIFPMPLLFSTIFLFLMAISINWAPFPNATRTISFLQINLLSIIIVNVVRKPDGLKYVFYGIISGLLYSGLYLFLDSSTLDGLKQGERAGSVVGNPNAYSFALLVGVILIANRIVTVREKAFPKILLYILGVMFFSYQILYATGSRKGFILLFLFLGLLTLLMAKRVNLTKKVFVSFFLVGSMVISLWWVKELPVFQRILNISLYIQGESIGERSLGTRVLMYATGLELFYQRPLLGWGAQQYEYISGFKTYSHSNFIEILANHGVIGLFIYYMLFVSLISRVWRLKKKTLSKKEKAMRYWILTSIVFLLVWDVAAVSYYNKLFWILLATLIGVTSYLNSVNAFK